MINKELTVDEYFDDPVNTTMINERCIELALGLRYMEKVGNDNLTEVGCVMPFYGYCEHPIIDLFEKDEPAGDVQNVDAEECDFTGRDVLCLSTLEHIGKEEAPQTEIYEAVFVPKMSGAEGQSRTDTESPPINF